MRGNPSTGCVDFRGAVLLNSVGSPAGDAAAQAADWRGSTAGGRFAVLRETVAR